jgi:hypothetical protein
MKIVLRVEGLGHVPSFKNSKVIGQRRLFTKPEYRLWMDRVTRSFESQLLLAFQTTDAGTWTAHSAPSLTVWWKRFDDSHQWVPELNIERIQVPKGKEGAVVMIESLE